MTQVLLVQHAGDFHDIHYTDGQFDPAIGPAGVARAERLRERLAPVVIDAVYASPLRRSRETAAVLTEGRDLDVRIHEGLKEIFLGELEPRHASFNDLVREGTDPVMVEFLRTRSWDAIPGAEPDAAFRKRCRAAIDDIAAEWPEGTVLVAGHGASIGAIVAEMLGASTTVIFYPENCSLTAFTLRDGFATFLLVNDCRDRDLLFERSSPIY